MLRYFYLFLFTSSFCFAQDSSPLIREVIPLLKSKSWTHQAFGLMRMEKYSEDENVPAILNAIISSNKYDWHTKAFALRAAGNMKIKISEESLSKLRDPILIRAALYADVEIKKQAVENAVLSNLRSKDTEKVLAAIELAVASDSKKAREMAVEKVYSLLKRLDHDVYKSLIYAERLCRVIGIEVQGTMNFMELARRKPALLTKEAFKTKLNLGVKNNFNKVDDEKFNEFTMYYEDLQDKDLDVVVAIDGTGSMGRVLRKTQAQTHMLMKIFDDLAKSMEFGVIVYRDYNDGKVQVQKLTGNISYCSRFLSRIRAFGGGDHPEWVLSGVQKADSVGWRKNSQKNLIIIGDAPPHARNAVELEEEIRSLREYKQVNTHALVTSQLDIEEFKSIAKWGSGQYSNLTSSGDIAKEILKFSMDPMTHDLFDDFYNAYIIYCL